MQFHTKKCTRRNCTNFATKYENSCENVLNLVWFGTKIKTSPTNFCRCLEFNIFLSKFLCKSVLYIFLCGFALIFDYYFLLCSSRNLKNLRVLGRDRLGLHLWFAQMSLFWHWITTRSVRPLEKSKWTISCQKLPSRIILVKIKGRIIRSI